MDHDVHRDQRAPSAQPHRERLADRAQLSRDRHAAFPPPATRPARATRKPSRQSRCLPWGAPSTRRD
jgi:hypothetical protein